MIYFQAIGFEICLATYRQAAKAVDICFITG